MSASSLDPDTEPHKNPELLLNQGMDAFDRGDYQKAVAYLEQAEQQTNLMSPLGGEVRLWLVNAYDAVGKAPLAVALCRNLVNHQKREIRQQASYLLDILAAPKLRSIKDGLVEFPTVEQWQPYGTGAEIPKPIVNGNPRVEKQLSPAEQLSAQAEAAAHAKNTLSAKFLALGLGITLLALAAWAIW
ncbi:MAG: tetratricopeptide repeat protein [Pseudanabaena sp. ELA607]|jgi:hypothetical protein